jgi:hypothetical protein
MRRSAGAGRDTATGVVDSGRMTRQTLHGRPQGPTRRSRRARLAGLLTGLALALPAAGQAPPTGWRCASDVATAYRFDPARGRWKTLVLPVTGQSFLVRPGAGRPWEIVWQGGDGTTLACAGDFDAAGELRCGDEQLFTVSRTTLTFSSRVFGRANGNLGDDLAAATITGQCTPLPP